MKSLAFFVQAGAFLFLGLFVFTIPFRPMPDLAGPQRWMTNIPPAYLYFIGGVAVIMSLMAIAVVAHRILSGTPALTVSRKGILVPKCYDEVIIWPDIENWQINKKGPRNLQIVLRNPDYHKIRGAKIFKDSIIVDLTGVSKYREIEDILSHYENSASCATYDRREART